MLCLQSQASMGSTQLQARVGELLERQQEKVEVWRIRNGGCHFQSWFLGPEQGKYKLHYRRYTYWPGKWNFRLSVTETREKKTPQNTRSSHLHFHFQGSSNSKSVSATHTEEPGFEKYQVSDFSTWDFCTYLWTGTPKLKDISGNIFCFCQFTSIVTGLKWVTLDWHSLSLTTQQCTKMASHQLYFT